MFGQIFTCSCGIIVVRKGTAANNNYFNSPAEPDGKEDKMKSVGKLSVVEMVEGVKYPTVELGRCKSSICPCCGKAIAKHDFAVAVHDGTKRTTGYKRVVGVGCNPAEPEHPEWCDTLALKWRLGSKNREETRALIMRATENYPGRKVEFDDKKNYCTLTLYKDEMQGCQQIGKLPAVLHLETRQIKMSINGSEWEPYDSEKVTNVLTIAVGYRGQKVYGI